MRAILRNLPYAAVIGATIWWCVDHRPITFMDSHRFSIGVSIVAVLLGAGYASLQIRYSRLQWPWWPGRTPRQSAPVKIFFCLLLCTTILAVFNYYKFDKRMLTQVNDYMDDVYYYTNSKYFSELGHFDLYAALLIADQEGSKRMRDVKRFRDLRNDVIVNRQKGLSVDRVEEVKGHFSTTRWKEFKHDVEYFSRRYHDWPYLMIDRGYNPPITWTYIGGTLSRYTPIEDLKRITMIDFALITLTVLVIGRAFGSAVMMFSLLWFCFTFSGRWPLLGQALLRFDWVAALTMSVCMMKLNKPGWAGGLLTYSMLSRVFPVLYFFPWFIFGVRDAWKGRGIQPRDWRFVKGSALVFCLLMGATLIQFGPRPFVESYESLKLHAKTYSSHRVGLGVVLAYQGETTQEEFDRHGGTDGKRTRINNLKPVTYTIGWVTIGLLSMYIWRTKRPLHDLIFFATVPLFCVTVAQTNYYNLRFLLVIAHTSDLSKWRNRVGLTMLFLVETLSQTVMATGAPRYVVTLCISFGLLIYFVVYCGFLVFEFLGDRKASKEHAPVSLAATTTSA